MGYHFVDSTSGLDTDTAHDMDLAWALFEYAYEAGALIAGDVVLLRPTHSEVPGTDIAPIYDGTAKLPIISMGWPRAAILNTTITQADFTNGSKIIDNVVGITINRQQHTNRYITAPDGKQYHITAIIWESGIDGMAAGAEFAVGEILTNTTQTKKGKVWGFTDNADTTGILQYVRDSATAWVDNNNITSSGGGDAEIDVGGETAVGFILSAEYAGATVTGVNGKFQIDADPDYAMIQFSSTFTAVAATDVITIDAHPYKLADCVRVVSDTTLPAGLAANTDYYVIVVSSTTIKLATTAANALAGTVIDITDTGTGVHTLATIEDSTWTIKKTAWDAHGMPLIDFNDGAFQFGFSADLYYKLIGLEIKDTTDSTGFMYNTSIAYFKLQGCLLKQTTGNVRFFYLTQGSYLCDRCIIEGSGAGASQHGIEAYSGGNLYFKDSVIMNCGDVGVYLNTGADMHYDGLNIGIEMANGDADILITIGEIGTGKGLNLGGTNGYVTFGAYVAPNAAISSVDSQKILGNYKKYFPGGTLERVAITAEYPDKKVSDDVLKISPNISGKTYTEYFAIEVFRHTFEVTTASQTYKYWLCNNMGITLNPGDAKENIWLVAEYVDSYDDTSEYTKVKADSTEIDIADAAGVTDWDFLSVTCQAAIASKVVITCYVSVYAAAVADIYIDPAVVVS